MHRIRRCVVTVEFAATAPSNDDLRMKREAGEEAGKRLELPFLVNRCGGQVLIPVMLILFKLILFHCFQSKLLSSICKGTGLAAP